MRYFFDLTNGHGLLRDDEGQEIADRQAIEFEVSRILTDVTRDELPHSSGGRVLVEVRDAQGHDVYAGNLVFEKTLA